MSRVLFYFAVIFSEILTAQVVTPDLEASVPMRDSKTLATDVYLPGNGSYPVILIQTPYNKNLFRLGLPLGIGSTISSSDYVFVIADWRCFYASTAACSPTALRGEDGYDLMEWIKDQPWCNGKIGTWGPSALGVVQFQTAREQHPNHVCAVPLVAAPQTLYTDYYPGGCLRTEFVDQLAGLGYTVSQVVSNPVYNVAWQFVENGSSYPAEIQIPVFLMGGWYDHNIAQQVEIYNLLRTQSAPGVRTKHRFLSGPWAHGGFNGNGVGATTTGELSYPVAVGKSTELAIDFFDFYLRGVQNGWEASPNIQFYRMGDEVWESASEFPFSNTINRQLYLSPGNKLLPVASLNAESTSFPYDPGNPSPTVGGPTLRADLEQGPFNQIPDVEGRTDALVFSTEILTMPVKVAGTVKVKIYLSSDRTDTDLCIRLTDVYPDGRSMLLADGVRRLRFRESYSNPSLIAPGTVYPVEIELPPTVNTFMAGHQIRLVVTSSNYPRFDANLNNGGTMYIAGDSLVATQMLYMSSEFPSQLEIPVQGNFTLGTVSPSAVGLLIFPNPASESISISGMTSASCHVELYSIGGKLIKAERKNPTSGHFSLSITDLPKGVYMLRIDQGFSSKPEWRKIAVVN